MSGVLLGSTDVDLRDQPIRAAEFHVATVFTSPLRRAARTAEYLFPNHRAIVLDGLAERGLGVWEGLTWQEVESSWPELASRALVDWFGTTPPSGERWSHVVDRVAAVLRVIRKAAMPVAVVAHAGVNALLAEMIAGRKPVELRQAYLEVLTFELEG